LKKRAFDLAKLLISAVLLVVLFTVFDLQESLAALRGIDLRYLAIAFLLFQTSMLIRSFRWRFLLDAVHVPVPIHRLLYLYYVGTFFNTFLPSGFGGDAVKMIELARYSQRSSESVGTVLVDRLAGIIVLFIMGLMALPFAYRRLPAEQSWFLLVVSVVGLLGSWVLFRKAWVTALLRIVPGKVGRKVTELYEAIHACGTGALAKSLAVSALFNVTLFGLNYAIALGLGLHIPFSYFIAFMPILSLSMLIPSVGALGTREGAYALLFGAAGVAEPLAIAMSLAYYVINVATGIIGATLYGLAALRGLGGRE
jgi:hypothetical protein